MGQAQILKQLSQKPMSCKELSKRLDVSTGSISVCLKRLRKAKMVKLYHPKLEGNIENINVRGYKNIIFST